MKLHKEDLIVVITGKDKGKTGKIMAVLPKSGQVIVEGINIVKRHTKPSTKIPRGGILELTKPLNVSKVMIIDPASGKPARIGYQIAKNGKKERVFKVSPLAKKTIIQTKTTKPKTASKADEK